MHLPRSLPTSVLAAAEGWASPQIVEGWSVLVLLGGVSLGVGAGLAVVFDGAQQGLD